MMRQPKDKIKVQLKNEERYNEQAYNSTGYTLINRHTHQMQMVKYTSCGADTAHEKAIIQKVNIIL